jgi:putative ABC transport system permease protein
VGDAEALADKTFHPDLGLIAPTYSSNAQMVNVGANTSGQVIGTTPEYLTIRNLTVADGTWLTQDQVTDLNNVVVIGATVAEDLFAGEDPLDQMIRINNEPFTVVGVLKASGGNGFNSVDGQAFIPLGVAQGRLFSAPRYRGEYTVSNISISAINDKRIQAAEQEIEQTLRLRHRLAAGDENDFNIFSQDSLLDALSSVTATITLLLGGIGAVSLLVGGIGIMNIMLVTVTERTKEIGLRKALGAHDIDILQQFLVEALVLTVIGGIAGIGLSYGVAGIVAQIPGSTFRILIGASSIILALSVSLGSGIVFGLYPALSATKLDPIEALRYE